MTGNLYRGQAGLPFSSSLRIYEPLEAFPPEQQRQLVAESGKIGSRAAVENAELQASLGRITRTGGDPFPTGRTDLVRMTRVPPGRHAAPATPRVEAPVTKKRTTPDGCFTAPANW
jgi:hypothetical protein